MSTDYKPMQKIRAADLFDGRLETFGVREHIVQDTTDDRKCLTDGRNYLWVWIDKEGFVLALTRYFPNGSPSKILRAIAAIFDTDIFSEHEPQYWGFESQKEWDADLKEMAREQEDEFYGELIKFVSGQPADIGEGTIGWIKAQIAKELVKDDPRLSLPEERERLMKDVEAVWRRDHCNTAKLSENDIALIEMIAMHEDDMGQA